MLNRTSDNRHHSDIVANRKVFCEKAGLDYEQCVYQIITYEPSNSYDVIEEVSEPNLTGVHGDVLYTETPGVGLFLPVADCIATVIYDSKRHALALAHLGRHASLSKAIKKTIDTFKQKGSDSRDLIVWMAPSVSGSHYRMEYFGPADSPEWREHVKFRDGGYYVDMAGHNRQVFIEQGILNENIYMPTVDTATNADYFSHSQGDISGRFAVVAVLK